MSYVSYGNGVHDGAIRNIFDHGVLCISTSEWVLCTLLAGQNHLFFNLLPAMVDLDYIRHFISDACFNIYIVVDVIC